MQAQTNQLKQDPFGVVLDALHHGKSSYAKDVIDSGVFWNQLCNDNGLVGTLLLDALGWGNVDLVRYLLGDRSVPYPLAYRFHERLVQEAKSPGNPIMRNMMANIANSDMDSAYLVRLLAKIVRANNGDTWKLVNGEMSGEFAYRKEYNNKTPLEWSLCPKETGQFLPKTAIALIAHGAETWQLIHEVIPEKTVETLHDYLFYHPYITWYNKDREYQRFLKDWFNADKECHSKEPDEAFRKRWYDSFVQVAEPHLGLYLRGEPGYSSLARRLTKALKFMDARFKKDKASKGLQDWNTIDLVNRTLRCLKDEKARKGPSVLRKR